MRYLFTLENTQEAQDKMLENIDAVRKEITELIEQTKPEAMYFSTIRRLMFIVMNVEDPHVELRKIFESLSKFGIVTIDPVSTFEEFGPFMASL
jgi:uncharacterized protein with ATP-grasp and redox domains